MLDYHKTETYAQAQLHTTPTCHQVQISKILATGLPNIDLPRELVEAVKNYVFQVWSPALSFNEDMVLRTLLGLTVERCRRDCVIDLDNLWPIVKSVLSSGVLDPFNDETYQGDPQENHERAMHDLVRKGLVNFTICESGWICAINFLWNPEFDHVEAFVRVSGSEAD